MAVAVFAAAAAIFVTAAAAVDNTIGDAEALAIVHRHCVLCHAAQPRHPSFAQPPKKVKLESLGELKQHAAPALQTLRNKSMPLGNAADMTEAERDKLMMWLRAIK